MERAPTRIVRQRVDAHNHRTVKSPAQDKSLDFRKQPFNTELVEHALVINLPRSTERLAAFMSSNVFEGTTEVIEAIDGARLTETKMLSGWKGDSGCLASHKKALEYAKEKGWNYVMIFEDDISFAPDFNNRLKQAMLELPQNWDGLWLGGKDRYPSYPYSSLLKINTGMWGAYGFIIKHTLYDFFISKFAEDVHSTDDYYSEYHSAFNCFKTAQDLIIHVGNVSDRRTINHNAK